jgi:hypothetical protein
VAVDHDDAPTLVDGEDAPVVLVAAGVEAALEDPVVPVAVVPVAVVPVDVVPVAVVPVDAEAVG